jgi:hypothetical protein
MTNMTNPNRLSQWLFNPFRFAAGVRALLIGLAIILLSGFIGSLSSTHFDGVLDVHTGRSAPLWFFLAESVIDWICLAVPLFFFGLIVSRSSFRFVDVIGTQALARWPYVITAIVMLPNAVRRVVEYLVAGLTQVNPAVEIGSMDVLVFVLAMLAAVLMAIWMVELMYKAYTVSCNIKGARAVITFIVSLIGAEILSKLVIYSLVNQLK